MKLFRAFYGRIKHRVDHAVIHHGTRPFMIYSLALLALLDAFVPMTANMLIVVLAILQPSRHKSIIVVFAISAGVSSFMFAYILGNFSGSAEAMGVKMFGEHWETAQAMVQQFGPGLLVLLAIFPDIPRPSITVISLAGVAPIWIGCMVFLGKLVLYSLIIRLVEVGPRYLATRKQGEGGTIRTWIQSKARRFQAYRRALNARVLQNQERNMV